MTSSDDILHQIDDALGDGTVGPDAMRSQPAPDEQVRGSLSPGARQFLIGRLVDNHGLTRMTARHAILAVEQSRDSQYADLVRAEAHAIVDETLQRLRDAMRPAFEAAGQALRTVAEACKQACVPTRHGDWIDSNGDENPAVPVAPLEARTARKSRRRTDRPAWQSPHGPAQRRQ